ncbi:MAG: hypothetical protein V2I76_02775, partial [Roseobacter sp.]|nr:hypothetical protein [Roseobacter sp.]
MNKNDFLKVTRRAFLSGSTALTLIPGKAVSQAVTPKDLQVVTRYREYQPGEERLVLVRFILSEPGEASSPPKQIDITPETFGPEGVQLELINLRKTEGNFVDPNHTFLLVVRGVDMFGQAPRDAGGDGTLVDMVFEIDAIRQEIANGQTPRALWRMRLETNAWRKGGVNSTNTFYAAGRGPQTDQFLESLLDGRPLFQLPLGPGWISDTLGAVLQEPVSVRDDFRAQFQIQKNAGDRQPVPTRSFWTVTPSANGDARLGFFGGFVSVAGLAFGWRYPIDAPPQFSVGIISSAFVTNPVSLSERSFPASGRQDGSVIDVALRPNVPLQVEIRCDALDLPQTDAPNQQRNTRSARMFLRGDFDIAVRKQDVTHLRAAFSNTEPGEPPVILQPVESGGRWRLFIEGLAQLKGTGHPAVRIAQKGNKPHANAAQREAHLPKAPSAQSDDHIVTRDFGRVEVGESNIRLGFRARPLRSEHFGVQARLQTAPLWLTTGQEADESSVPDTETASSASFSLSDEPEHWPVLSVENLPLDPKMTGAARRIGQIGLDHDLMDVSLDQVVLSLRRARDFLVLDFRFAHMRAYWDAKAGRFMLHGEQAIPQASALAPDMPSVPVLVAEFPPQHMAEQAYLRRDNPLVSIPDPDWVDAARLIDGLVPTLDFGEEAVPLVSAQETVKGLLAELETAERPRRVAIRRELRAVVQGWRDDILSKLPSTNEAFDPLKASVEEVLAYQDRLEDVVSLSETVFQLPEDQRVFIGARYTDPDILQRLWAGIDAAGDETLVDKVKARLRQVEGWPATTEGPNIVPADPTVLEQFRQLAESRFASDINILTPQQATQLQDDLTRIKEAVAPDYRLFRDMWRDAARVTALADGAAEFISTRWAEDSPLPGVAATYETVLRRFADPTGALAEPVKATSRARWSGASRLAFNWQARSTDARDPERGATVPMSVARLLDWSGWQQSVQRRADVLTQEDPGGAGVVRRIDDARMLEFQGIKPKANKTATEHMAEVYTAAARAPTRFESALEVPFRLQLSTAPDALVELPTPVPDAFFDFDPLPGNYPEFGETVFSVSFPAGGPDSLLRAIWSDDFRPETLLKGVGRMQLDHPSLADIDAEKRRELELLNTVYDTPPRGAQAPWFLPQVKRVNGRIEIVESDPQEGTQSDEALIFRASMDAYDRDQIVKSSSVPGLPAVVGRTEEALELRRDAQAFEPPPGYELIDLQTTEVEGLNGEVLRRDLSAIYRPQTLDFRELTLMAPGATLNLDTSFQPPFPARRADGVALYEALSLERWRHRSVRGRDIKVELVYRGYLFPLGVRAALIKVTERKYVLPGEGSKRGPTAILQQRLFVRVAQPRKNRWYGQPLAGRGWPCQSIDVLTTETPDLMDVFAG